MKPIIVPQKVIEQKYQLFQQTKQTKQTNKGVPGSPRDIFKKKGLLGVLSEPFVGSCET